jgi:hypothetical protein
MGSEQLPVVVGPCFSFFLDKKVRDLGKGLMGFVFVSFSTFFVFFLFDWAVKLFFLFFFFFNTFIAMIKIRTGNLHFIKCYPNTLNYLFKRAVEFWWRIIGHCFASECPIGC